MSDENVVELRPPSENLRCDCGSEWWATSVVIDAATAQVTGHLTEVTCQSCAQSQSWPEASL